MIKIMNEHTEIKMTTDVREQIEDLLYSVQNEQGNSHLFDTDLCNSVTDSIMEIVKENLIRED